VDRSQVNAALYGLLRGRAVQDESYRWWPADRTSSQARKTEHAPKTDTPLARLCRYYLDCLNHDDQGGLSVFASSKFGDLDYVEVDNTALMSGASEMLFESEATRGLLNKLRQDRGRLTLMLGYPVRLNRLRARSGWEGLMVEPILLFGFQEDAANRFALPSLSDELPQINFRAVKSLSSPDNPGIVEEVIQLSVELGLASATAELPDLEEISLRLKAIRPEWDWKEEPVPTNLSSDPSLAQLSSPGIYNRAVLVVAERSPYTKGLETELAKLQSVPETDYLDTALGAWLSGQLIEAQAHDQQPILEILPLNSEQRQAVTQGMHNALTVITGPPGTGKSQVVTSLLVNAAWQGKTVLFASKNNKAVDVVETRVNNLGPRPVLLRLGANAYQTRLAEYLVSLLAATATAEDEHRHQEAIGIHDQIRKGFEALDTQLVETIRLRNEVDRLEQQVEAIRERLGKTLFQSFAQLDPTGAESAAQRFRVVVERADRAKQPLLVRLFWRLFKKNRYQQLSALSGQFRSWCESLGIELPAAPPGDETMRSWLTKPAELIQRVGDAISVHGYFGALKSLASAKSLEQVSRERRELVEELAEASEALWHTWLRLQPKRLSREERKLLGDYCSLLELIVKSNESGNQLGKQVFARYHALFPKITSILSCWAVTSLSARGRVPFEPGFFDLLVIDEASQCDIASALPLLYRARRAVIIGDPKQLRHISSLPPEQDRQLLAKHELVEGSVTWAYSTNSLFDRASRGLCRSEDIIALRDHHRSHADIIEFSNHHFYEGQLRMATKYERLRRPSVDQPAVRWIETRGKVVRPAAGGAVNGDEAQAVLREIERLVLRQGYKGSIGVVSPFRAQANRIREMALQHEVLATRLPALEFLADTVHRFQGDERDVMIFSPVVSTGVSDGALIFLRNNPNLFNVAITRARSALIVVGDRQAALESRVDYLARFAEYVGNLGTRIAEVEHTTKKLGPEYPKVARPELVSDWEKVLYRALYAEGIRTIPQYEVEKYILDFALMDGDRKLNIEVDGERYHRNWDGELCCRDQIRNQRLMELGWDIVRFWVYQVRDDLSGCVASIRSWASTR
jgi:very-short-patch-repair endonuclease